MKYELRTLCSSDLFPLAKIIDQIGFAELTGCFSKPEVKKAIETGNESAVGISVGVEIVSIIFSHMEQVENDLYKWLSSVTGATVAELRSDSMPEFVELLVEIIRKEEFKDFISVVSRLLKPVE